MMVQHTCDGLTPPELIKDLAGNLLFIVYTPGHKIPAMLLSWPLLGVIKHLMSNTCTCAFLISPRKTSAKFAEVHKQGVTPTSQAYTQTLMATRKNKSIRPTITE